MGETITIVGWCVAIGFVVSYCASTAYFKAKARKREERILEEWVRQKDRIIGGWLE